MTRNLFVDSVVHQLENVRFLHEKIGPARILFGTDYPLRSQGAILQELPDAALLIGGANAAALLGLQAASRH